MDPKRRLRRIAGSVADVSALVHPQILDESFGSESWRTEVIGADLDERLGRAIPPIAQGVGGRSVLPKHVNEVVRDLKKGTQARRFRRWRTA